MHKLFLLLFLFLICNSAMAQKLRTTKAEYEQIPKKKSSGNFGVNNGSLNSIDLTPWFQPHYNQGTLNSCVAFSIAYILGYYYSKAKNLEEYQSWFSPSFIFHGLAAEKNVEITGCKPLKALDFVKRRGCCMWSTLDYSQKAKRDIPLKAETEAEGYRIKGYESLRVGQFYPTLADGHPILVCLPWHGNASTGLYETKDGPSLGGHAVTILGYDPEKNAYRFINSQEKPKYGLITETLLLEFQKDNDDKAQDDEISFEAYQLIPSIKYLDIDGPIPIIDRYLANNDVKSILKQLGNIENRSNALIIQGREELKAARSNHRAQIILRYLSSENVDIQRTALWVLSCFTNAPPTVSHDIKQRIKTFLQKMCEAKSNQDSYELGATAIRSLVILQDPSAMEWVFKFLEFENLNINSYHLIAASLILFVKDRPTELNNFIDYLETSDLRKIEKMFYIFSTLYSAPTEYIKADVFFDFLFALLKPALSWKVRHFTTLTLYQTCLEYDLKGEQTRDFWKNKEEANFKVFTEKTAGRQIDDEYRKTALHLAYIYYITDKLKEAQLYWHHSLESQDPQVLNKYTSYTYVMLGRCCLENENYSEALKQFSTALDRDGTNLIASIWKTKVIFKELPARKADILPILSNLKAEPGIETGLTVALCEIAEEQKVIQLQKVEKEAVAPLAKISILLTTSIYERQQKNKEKAHDILVQLVDAVTNKPSQYVPCVYESSIMFELSDAKESELLDKFKKDRNLKAVLFHRKINFYRKYR